MLCDGCERRLSALCATEDAVFAQWTCPTCGTQVLRKDGTLARGQALGNGDDDAPVGRQESIGCTIVAVVAVIAYAVVTIVKNIN